MEHPMRVLGRHLDELRRRHGLSYRDVEQRTGLSRSTVQYLVTRRTNPPDYYELVALVDRLGGSWDDSWEQLWRQVAGLDGRDDEQLGSGGPTQLPPAVRGFCGRAVELANLDALLPHLVDGGPLVVAVLSGTAGVGKTALALHWAHGAKVSFPDGQLYLDLHGYGPEPPLSVEDALGRLLAGLGQVDSLPSDVDQRADLLRTLLDGRRMLVLLDNAAEVEQLRLLLPGTATCMVLVTSRDSLPGFVARYGAWRVDLAPLPEPDAVQLLATLIGERVTAEPAAAAALADLCDRLPLALRVAAELVVARPGDSLADLAGEVSAGELDRLDAGGDPRADVRAVLSWSYRHLAEGPARLFRLLGLVPGHDIDSSGAAALTGVGLQETRQDLHVLVQASLVQVVGADRYGLHDLLRAYARGLAGSPDAALARLAAHYLRAAASATDLLFGADRERSGVPGPLPSGPATAAEALRWLDAERPALVAASSRAPELSSVLVRYLEQGGHHSDAAIVHGNALSAARSAGDRAAEADAEANLAASAAGQGRFDVAATHLQVALGLRDGPDARAAVLSSLGAVRAAAGDMLAAEPPLQEALTLHARLADPAGEARVRSNLSGVLAVQDRLGDAAGELERALALFRGIGDRTGAARALANLGDVRARQGREDEAARHLADALEIFESSGDRVGAANAFQGLADLLVRQGRHQEAVARYEQALVVFREIGDHAGAARAELAMQSAAGPRTT